MHLSLGTAALASGEASGSEETAASSLEQTDPAWKLSADESYYQLTNVVYLHECRQSHLSVHEQLRSRRLYRWRPGEGLYSGDCAHHPRKRLHGLEQLHLWPGQHFVSRGGLRVHKLRARSRNAENGVGKMPAPIVDQKAAARNLRLNDAVIPGDKGRIVSVGAAGIEFVNGAYVATIDDDIFASQCFCPITDLNNADLAYVWLRYDTGEQSSMTVFSGEIAFPDFQPALQDGLALAFCEYINSLGLVNEEGEVLSFDLKADGTPILAAAAITTRCWRTFPTL